MPKSRSVVSVKKHLIRNKKLEKDILSSEGKKNKKTSSLQLFSVSFNSQTSDVIDVVLLLRGEKCHDCDFKTTDSQCLRDHIDEKHDLQKIGCWPYRGFVWTVVTHHFHLEGVTFSG